MNTKLYLFIAIIIGEYIIYEIQYESSKKAASCQYLLEIFSDLILYQT